MTWAARTTSKDKTWQKNVKRKKDIDEDDSFYFSKRQNITQYYKEETKEETEEDTEEEDSFYNFCNILKNKLENYIEFKPDYLNFIILGEYVKDNRTYSFICKTNNERGIIEFKDKVIRDQIDNLNRICVMRVNNSDYFDRELKKIGKSFHHIPFNTRTRYSFTKKNTEHYCDKDGNSRFDFLCKKAKTLLTVMKESKYEIQQSKIYPIHNLYI